MLDGPRFEVDINTVNQNIDEAQVVSLFFPLLQKTLLLDTRSDGEVGPFVALVEMVESSAQRFRSLRQLRPQLPRPDSITMIPWGLGVGALSDTGAWDHLLRRLDDCGGPCCMEAATR